MADAEEENKISAVDTQENDYEISKAVDVPGRPKRDGTPRDISLASPEERKTRFKTWLVYPVSSEPSMPGVVSVCRRYSDFEWLRDCLCKQFPGMCIPPLPPKRMWGNFEELFVEERRVDLERFLNRVEMVHPFHSNIAFTMFLCRPEASFKDGQKEVASGLPSTIQEKTAILTQLYPDLHSEELHEEAEQDLVRIKEFFDKTHKKLQQVHDCSHQVLATYSQAKNEALLLHNNLSELYHVEQNYPYRDSPSRLDVADEFSQWSKFHEKQEKYFKRHVLRNIRYELQDVEAILEQISRVQDLQNQYEKAHKKAENWRKQEKELTEKQEAAQAADFENESALRELVDICIKIVLLSDVETIWGSKIEAFKKDMYQYSTKAMQFYNELADSWSGIKADAAS